MPHLLVAAIALDQIICPEPRRPPHVVPGRVVLAEFLQDCDFAEIHEDVAVGEELRGALGVGVDGVGGVAEVLQYDWGMCLVGRQAKFQLESVGGVRAVGDAEAVVVVEIRDAE